MNDEIRHDGVVERVEEGCLHVRILQATACGGCQVSAHCHIAEGKEKLIDVVAPEAHCYEVGDSVEVVWHESRCVGLWLAVHCDGSDGVCGFLLHE